MNKNYFELWGILASAFAIFFLLSMCGEIKVGAVSLRSSHLADGLFGRDDTDQPADTIPGTPAETIAETEPVVPDTVPKTILFIGDSMLDGLNPRLAAYCDASADTLYSVIWYSSTSEAWGKSDKLKDYIKRLNPGYVFICLGANELFVSDIAAKRDKYVKSIIKQIGDIPYLWIGPPNWKEDTGINDLIAANTAPGCFFLSNGMTFSRRKDGAHPTAESACEWMDSVLRWMPDNSPHPLRFLPPEKKTSRSRKVFIHSPKEL